MLRIWHHFKNVTTSQNSYNVLRIWHHFKNLTKSQDSIIIILIIWHHLQPKDVLQVWPLAGHRERREVDLGQVQRFCRRRHSRSRCSWNVHKKTNNVNVNDFWSIFASKKWWMISVTRLGDFSRPLFVIVDNINTLKGSKQKNLFILTLSS